MKIFHGSESIIGRENNNSIEHINKLKKERDVVLKNKELTLNRVDSLMEESNAQETEEHSIIISLAESCSTAADIEKDIQAKSRAIIADAEAVVAAWKSQLALLEQEIAAIQQKMEPDSTFANREPGINSGYAVEMNNPQEQEMPRDEPRLSAFNAGYSTIISGEKSGIDIEKNFRLNGSNCNYHIQLVSFVNARHYVMFGGKNGPVHAHSWKAQIEVEVPFEKGEVMGFAKISNVIDSTLAPFENTVLNSLHPFNQIQPTTENIAMFFYNKIEESLSALGLGLAELTLWETPTRGIQVSSRNPNFEQLQVIYTEPEDVLAAHKQAAAVDNMGKKSLVGKAVDFIAPKMAALQSAQPPELPRPVYPQWQYLIAAAIIIGTAFIAYYDVIFPPVDQRFPWGSDTWAHLFKADYLYNEILKGNYYPQFTAYWYNGSQPFRYWAPLSYYAVAALEAITGDVFTAGNLYVFLCALFGSLSWLLFARKIGLWQSVMGGLLWLVWLDNVRIAFSEGNFPRILATALLPLLFILFLRILEKRKSWGAMFLVVCLVHLVVLSHAMIGAIYFLGLGWFALFLWILGGCHIKDCIVGVAVLLIGIASSAWWLLPSLTGGITEIDASSVKATLEFISPLITFDPLVRFSSIDTFYLGTSLLVGLIVIIFTWNSKPTWAKSLALCGILFTVITFPIIKNIYVILPLSHLLFPFRFSSFAALAILLASLSFNMPEQRQPFLKSRVAISSVLIGVFMVFMLDSLLSFSLLAHTGEKPSKYIQAADYVKKKPGWRVATIDLSQYGSAPSYAFSKLAGLEQVFGWAWQGAVTSQNIMLLNTGLEMQYYPFLFRSCVDLGATELVVKDDVVKNLEDFINAATNAGYKYQETIQEISIWHSVDYPYMLEKKPECLVIGRYAGTVATQFPGVEMGFSSLIDQYSPHDLEKYSMIILSGAGWSSKKTAEKLITDFVGNGGQVIVELAGMPENVLAKQPEFLGIYGEPVLPRGGIEILGKDRNILLQPFSQDIGEWRSYVPMGLDHVELEFKYYGNQAPIYGYKLIEGKKVWFLGGNMTYHSFITGDPDALRLLKEIFQLSTDYRGGKYVPLNNYQASERGYVMTYQNDHDFEALLPITAIEGMKIRLDGEPWNFEKFENLIYFNLPAGTHTIEVLLTKTPIYMWGIIITGSAIVVMFLGLIYLKRKDEVIS